MDWVIGVRPYEQRALVLDGQEVKMLELRELRTVGLPRAPKRTRLVIQGEFSGWTATRPDEFMNAYGITPPVGAENQHMMFRYEQDGIQVVVPALAFMRTFFRPAAYLLERMFSPANIDAVSYIDHTGACPAVVIDDSELKLRVRTVERGVNREDFVRWLQLSKSARQTAQSVHRYSASGLLGLTMPSGRFRMTVHGLRKGKALFVNLVSLIEVVTETADSWTSMAERYIFHEMAKSVRTPLASTANLHVPLLANGSAAITDEEWVVVENLLKASQNRHTIHCQRSLLDAALLKISTNCAWDAVPTQVWNKTHLTNAFRRWVLSGRLQKVLTYLVSTRGSKQRALHQNG